MALYDRYDGDSASDGEDEILYRDENYPHHVRSSQRMVEMRLREREMAGKVSEAGSKFTCRQTTMELVNLYGLLLTPFIVFLLLILLSSISILLIDLQFDLFSANVLLVAIVDPRAFHLAVWKAHYRHSILLCTAVMRCNYNTIVVEFVQVKQVLIWSILFKESSKSCHVIVVPFLFTVVHDHHNCSHKSSIQQYIV